MIRTVLSRPGVATCFNKATSYKHVTPARRQGNKIAIRQKSTGTSFFDRWLGPKTCEAPKNFTARWWVVAPAFFTHFCIGSPYAWSVMMGPLSRELGFVTAAALDWSLWSVGLPMSIAFAFQGIGAFAAGKWQIKVGPRASMALAGLLFGGGWLVMAAGVALHALPLMYAGSVMSGCGIGVAYTPPLQALTQWFPDKKGTVFGMCIGGFGSGAIFFAPLATRLMEFFSSAPQYLGKASEVVTTLKEGRMYADVGGQMMEVVKANANELSQISHDLAEGIYVVGTGSTGAAASLAVFGALYTGIMLASAFAIRTAPAGYVPKGYTPPKGVLTSAVPVDTAMKTPQFALLFTTFFCISTGGMGIMAVAKPMMAEIFGNIIPQAAMATVSSAYVMSVASGNLLGRLGWGAFSDKYGRRSTFHIFTLASIPLYLSIPFVIRMAIEMQTVGPIYVFIGTTVVAISMFGGIYSTIPAYQTDLYGAKYVGAIHGRMLLAGTTLSAPIGQNLFLMLRQMTYDNSIADLLTKVDPILFLQTFGAPVEQASELIKAKTLTIAKLMEIMPEGTIDPTPFIYTPCFLSMAGLMGTAAACHYFVRKVDPKLFEKPAGKLPDAKEIKEDEAPKEEAIKQTKKD